MRATSAPTAVLIGSAGRSTITAPTFPTPTHDPSTITGMVGRYRADSLALADGTNIVSWPDISGAGNTATNNGAKGANTYPILKTNVLGGHQGARFLATSKQWISSNAPAGGAAQTIVAIIIPTSNTGKYTYRGASGNGGLQVAIEGGKISHTSQNQVAVGNSTGTVTAGVANVVLSTWDSAAGSNYKINGTATTSSNTTTLTAQTTVIGANGSGVNVNAADVEGFTGDILELMVWSRVLTSAERIYVDSYAKDYYNITVSDYS